MIAFCFLQAGNTFYRSWGAGVMVFGHGTTSHNLTFVHNNFLYSGCVQALGDHASVALMCPNGNKPSGTVSYNKFINCPGVEAIWVSHASPLLGYPSQHTAPYSDPQCALAC